MIKHVLSVKLIDNSPEECQKVKELFLSMRGKVPCIRELCAGIDLLDSPQALEEYQKDPYHADVVKPYIHQVRKASVAVDYEMD